MGYLYHGIYKWASFHGYVKLPEGNIIFTIIYFYGPSIP